VQHLEEFRSDHGDEAVNRNGERKRRHDGKGQPRRPAELTCGIADVLRENLGHRRHRARGGSKPHAAAEKGTAYLFGRERYPVPFSAGTSLLAMVKEISSGATVLSVRGTLIARLGEAKRA
jgi:hypothetical protein